MGKEAQEDKEKMVGWDKVGHGTSQHDDPGSYTDSTRPSIMEKDHKELPLRASQALPRQQVKSSKTSH